MTYDLIIVIPAHNEARRLPVVLTAYNEFFSQSGIKYKIIVVDNASTDNTFSLVKQLNLASVELVQEQGLGKGRAVKTGFTVALNIDSNYIGFVDADGSTKAQEFFRLYQLAKNFDGVIASRLLPGAQVYGRTFSRQLVSRSFKFIRNLIVYLPFVDTQCGAKIFKSSVLAKIINELTVTDMAFDVQLLYLLYKHKFFIKEEPTIWTHVGASSTFDSPLALFKTARKMFSSIAKIK